MGETLLTGAGSKQGLKSPSEFRKMPKPKRSNGSSAEGEVLRAYPSISGYNITARVTEVEKKKDMWASGCYTEGRLREPGSRKRGSSSPLERAAIFKKPCNGGKETDLST